MSTLERPRPRPRLLQPPHTARQRKTSKKKSSNRLQCRHRYPRRRGGSAPLHSRVLLTQGETRGTRSCCRSVLRHGPCAWCARAAGSQRMTAPHLCMCVCTAGRTSGSGFGLPRGRGLVRLPHLLRQRRTQKPWFVGWCCALRAGTRACTQQIHAPKRCSA